MMSGSGNSSDVPAPGELPSSPEPQVPARKTVSSKNGSSAIPVYADVETERAVIAALMIDPSCLSTVTSILGGLASAPTPQDGRRKKTASDPDSLKKEMFHNLACMVFHDLKYAAVYEAILEMTDKGAGIDLLSLTSHFERVKRLDVLGGQDFLIDTQAAIASTANIESWCYNLRDYAMLREMLRTCSGAVDMCKNYQGNVKSLLDSVESEIFKVRNRFVQPEIRELRTLLEDTFQTFMDLIDRKIEPGIPTGYPDLDRLIGGGLKPGEMFVLAARPSIGKTAMALNIVRNIVMRDFSGSRKNVLFFSLEMSAEQVTQRMLCTEAHVPLSSIMDRNLKPGDIPRLTQAVSIMKDARLSIDPTAGISVFELRAKARKMNDQQKIDLIVIDYLQLMKSGEPTGNESRQVEVSAISGGLKKLAKDLGVPVLVLAQLNRELEKGQSAKALPKLSHLRESGAIEQDADVVVFLHRNRDDAKEQNPEANRAGVEAKLIVEKNRNGKTGNVELKFFPALMEFRSIDHRYSDSDRNPEGKPPENTPK